jgi:hypothetical protein
MEAIHDPGHSSVSRVARLVEVLQPLSLRADGLASMPLFAGLMRALAASPDQFRELLGRPAIRERLVAAVPTRRRRR